ncbi:MAG TPA: PAS domain S-box protein [Bacteroidota bacterium]|nr:PAS domain S-box protein [Bacteroidota bacterium]
MKKVITIPSPKKKRIIASFILIAAVFGASLIGYYKFESGKIREAAARTIQAIADLKIGQISQWQHQRYADARIVIQFPPLSNALKTWIHHPQDSALRRILKQRMKTVKSEYGYHDIFLVSASNDILLSLDASRNTIGPDERLEIAKAKNESNFFENDFFRSSIDQKIYYDVITPIRDSHDQTIAILIFRSNPDDFLYPLLKKWPTPNQTAETVLLRKEGDSILYLNELRFREHTALALKLPLTRTDLPAVQAALGKTGIFDGYDYRGMRTLAYLAPVPNTPWFMVAKIDHREIFEELTYRSIMIAIIGGIMLLLLGTLYVALYRHYQLEISETQLAEEIERRMLNEEFKAILYSMHEAVITTDLEGRVKKMNALAEELTLWSEAEAIGQNLERIYRVIDEETGTPIENPVERLFKSDRVNSRNLHCLLVTRDGWNVPIDDSIGFIRDKNGEITGMVIIFRNMTSERDREKLIIRSEEKYRTLVEHASDGIFLTDAQGRIMDVNPTGASMLGYSHHELIGRVMNDLYNKLSDEQNALPQSHTDSEEHTIEEREMIRKDGSLVPVEFSRNMLEGGGMIKIIRDISKRRQSENELQESRALLAESGRLGKIGGWSIDLETMRQSWSDEIFRIMEYDESMGAPSVPQGVDFILPAYRAMAQKAVEDAISEGKPFDQEWEILTMKGNHKWVHSIASVEKEHGKKRRIVGAFQDITERKQVEGRLAAREKEYNTLVGQLDEGFCVIEMIFDAEGHPYDYRFLETNPAFERQTGVKGALGKTMREIAPDHEPVWFEMFGRVAMTGEPLRMEAEAAALGRKFNFFASRIDVDGGNKIAIIFHDITERLEMEKYLRDIQRREAVGVLSAGIAHDFNNLLAVMMGNVSLAQMNLPKNHPAASNMAKALTAMETAAELTRQMLAYAGKGQFQILTIDLKQEIQTHVALFHVSVPKNVKLVTELPPHPVYVDGDPAQIKQVVMNLIINGADAIGDAQGSVTITLSEGIWNSERLAPYTKQTNITLAEGPYALIEVADTGSGMSPETISKIFDPFFTTKFVGRGLGLSAVLGIIRAAKGGIVIESKLGEGSVFRVVLPTSPHPPGVLNVKKSESLPGKIKTGAKVLVIDDEEEVAEMAKDILTTEGFAVIVETNPIQGIETYRKNQEEIAVVLLDLTMPEMPGEKVAESLVETDPAVKIIISSGYSESEVLKRLGSQKISGVIQKPYHINALITKINTVILQDGRSVGHIHKIVH